MYQYASLNGKIIAYDNLNLHISDVGIHRGYAIFDFFKVENGHIKYEEDYFDRFYTSSQLSGMKFDFTRVQLRAMILAIIHKNNSPTSYIKLLLTGGYSPDGFSMPSVHNLIILNYPLSVISSYDYSNGANLISQEYIRDFPEVKTTNYFMSVRLQKKMKEYNAIDVLYYTAAGVTESSRCNAFMIKNGVIYTADTGILRGVTRKQFLMKASSEFEIKLETKSIEAFREADEIFITSTTKFVLPIVKLDGNNVGNGKVGPICRVLIQKYG